MQSYVQDQDSLNVGSKLPELGISGLEFGKKLLLFEIDAFEFVKMQTFVYKQNSLHSRSKLPDLCIFGPEFENLSPYLKSALSDLLEMNC